MDKEDAPHYKKTQNLLKPIELRYVFGQSIAGGV